MKLKLAISILTGVWLLALTTTGFAEPITIALPDGNEITLPGGEESFADEVVNYVVGKGVEMESYGDPTDALGFPELEMSGSVALGDGGMIILKFTDNWLTTSGDDTEDLWIFEVGTTEPSFIAISTDGVNWVDAGATTKSFAGVDIDAYVGSGVILGEKYEYVKITDDNSKSESSSPCAGVDIDGVAAVSTIIMKASVLSVTPPEFKNVPAIKGKTTFAIANTGEGEMDWTVSEDADWFSITPVAGINNDTITVDYDANQGEARTGAIIITAPGASNSPQTLEIRQATGLVLSVTPTFLNIPASEGTATVNIANTSAGQMNWSALKNADWFSIEPHFGTNNSTITVNYESNSNDPRIGTITITANGADNSPRTVQLRQTHPDWKKVEKEPHGTLRGVWGTSANDVFVVGKRGTILHYDGTNWTEMDSGIDHFFRDIWGTSSDNVFAVSHDGAIMHYDGTTWKEMANKTYEDLVDIWGTSPENIFAVGENGTILHYDGTTWTRQPEATINPLNSIWGSSGNDVFAVGGTWDSFSIIHYDGNSKGLWTEMPVNIPDTPNGVWGSSGNDVFVVGNSGMILHYNGKAWKEMPSGTTDYLTDVWGTSHDNVFATGVNGTVLHYDGTKWKELATGTSEDLYGIWGNSENNMFAVGNSGTVLHLPYHKKLSGDADENGVVDLNDAILILKLLAGINVGFVNPDADVNSDGKIGMEEVFYILRIVIEN